MGSVYLAHDPAIDRQVAIKTITLSDSGDYQNELRQRFLREARAAGRLQHPNIIAVFFAEQGHRSRLHGLIHRHQPGLYRAVASYLGIDDRFNGLHLLRGHRLEVGEVEAQSLRIHQRALLFHLITQNLAQRPVQKVGRGVIAHGWFSVMHAIDAEHPPVPFGHAAGAHHASMEMETSFLLILPTTLETTRNYRQRSTQ